MRKLCLGCALLLLAVLCAPAQRPLREYVWLDRLPANPEEPFRACFFGPEGWGLNVDALSSYKMTTELYQFFEDETHIHYFFHHDNRKWTTAYRIEPLIPPTPDFDTRLTLDHDPNNGGQPTVYYTGPKLKRARLTGSTTSTIRRWTSSTLSSAEMRDSTPRSW